VKGSLSARPETFARDEYYALSRSVDKSLLSACLYCMSRCCCMGLSCSVAPNPCRQVPSNRVMEFCSRWDFCLISASSYSRRDCNSGSRSSSMNLKPCLLLLEWWSRRPPKSLITTRICEMIKRDHPKSRQNRPLLQQSQD
jgi:hypothetical protein